MIKNVFNSKQNRLLFSSFTNVSRFTQQSLKFNSSFRHHFSTIVDDKPKNLLEIQNSFLKPCLSELQFLNLTSIQKKVIPELLKGKDVLFGSETGSGRFSYVFFKKMFVTIHFVVCYQLFQLNFLLFSLINKKLQN